MIEVETESVEGHELSAPCVACGEQIAYTIDADGNPDGLIHAMPFCDRFLMLDCTPDAFADYLRACRLAVAS
jgi:hypothetical protein